MIDVALLIAVAVSIGAAIHYRAKWKGVSTTSASKSLVDNLRADIDLLRTEFVSHGGQIQPLLARVSSLAALLKPVVDEMLRPAPTLTETIPAPPLQGVAKTLLAPKGETAAPPAEPTLKAALRKEATVSENVGTGTIPAASLFENFDSLLFLIQVQSAFVVANLAWKVLSGNANEINNVINYLHNTGQEPMIDLVTYDRMSHYRGPLRDAVKPIVKAAIDARTNPFSKMFYQRMYDKYLAA